MLYNSTSIRIIPILLPFLGYLLVELAEDSLHAFRFSACRI